MSTNASVGLTSSSQAQATTSANASSSPTSTTTSTTPTSAAPAPATSSTTTTTPQSSPAQTSVATDATGTSPSSTSSTTFTSAVASTTALSSSTFTTQVATTLYSTDSAGSIVYVTTTVPDVVTSSVSSTTTSSSTSHTGVIVGAVVGGVAGIAILALLLFCIRRRVRKDEFDGNFDPDRIVGHTDGGGGGATLPQVDLADEVTPFPQSYTDQGSSGMRQYGESPYTAISSSLPPSGKASTNFYPPGTGAPTDAQSQPCMPPGAASAPYLPPINMYGASPADWHTPRPGISPPSSTVSNNTTSTRRATKEREALERSGQGQGLGLATQQEVAEGSGDVVVHQDAGRAPAEEHVPPREIPPAYESIRQD